MALATPTTEAERACGRAISDRPDECFCFLDLPAELRNVVYEACLQDMFSAPSWGRTSWRRRSSTIPCHFFELTQVCTQIRKEFHSMCLANAPKWIRLSRLHSYFETFHTSSDIADTIVVDMQEISGKYGKVVNILNLFIHLSEHPNVSCSFDYVMRDGRDTSLQALRPVLSDSVAKSSNANWKEALAKVVSIVPKTSTKNVLVTVKDAYRLKARSAARKEFEVDLCNELGLHRFKGWGVVVQYEWHC